MAADTSRLARVSAIVVAAGLGVIAGFQLYWTFGTWGLHEASGGSLDDPSTGTRISSGVLAILIVAAAAMVLARVGYLRPRIRFSLVRRGTWLLTVALFLGAATNLPASTAWERYGNGSIALVLAILSFVVAADGSHLHRPHLPHRPVPSG